jgi:flagellar protein FlaG
VRPNETQNLKVVSSSSPQKTVDGSEDLLKKAANIIERFLTNEETAPNTKLRIDRDEGSGNFIYQNVDEVSGEIISQFPTEKILQVLSFYRELEGLAVDEHA